MPRRMRTPRRLATLPRVRLVPASFPLMLPTLVEEVPRGPGWLFELKWDGVRVLALRAGGQVELWARSGARVTDRYPEIAAALAPLGGGDLALDGEVVALDAGGRALPRRPPHRVAQDQVRQAPGVRDRRLHGPQGNARGAGRRPPGRLRRRRARLCGPRRLGPRPRRPGRARRAAPPAHHRALPVHARQPAARARAPLGAAGAGVRGALLGVDERGARAPPRVSRAPYRSPAARGARRARGHTSIVMRQRPPSSTTPTT